MLAKMMAKMLLKRIIREASENGREDTIQLRKKKSGTHALEVEVNISCRPEMLSVYLDKLLIAAAKATDSSFEELIGHVQTTHTLMAEIMDDTLIEKEEVNDHTDDV